MESIKFEGPYSFYPGADSVFTQPCSNMQGMYIWALKYEDGYLVNYVGITNKPISQRLQEHIAHYCCGDYIIYEPDLFIKGKKEVAYEPNGSILNYFPNMVELTTKIDSLLKCFSLFIAAIDADKNHLERIESAVINELRQAGYISRTFLDNRRLSRSIKNDDKMEIKLTFPKELIGLKEKIHI